MDDTYRSPPQTPTSIGDGFFHDGDECKTTAPQQKQSTAARRTHAKKSSVVSSIGSISSTDRRRRMKLLERYLKQRDNSIIKLAVEDLQSSLVDVRQDGQKFDYLTKRDKKKGCSAFIQRMSYLNKKFGLRHILLLLLLIGYSLAGGAIFEAIERPQEIEDLNSLNKVLVQKISNTSGEIISFVLFTNETDRQEAVEMILKQFYKDMLDLEGKLLNSVFDKADNSRLVWNFGSGLFYSMALFTTTGYGTVSCVTTWGKVITVIYSSIGIPLILVVLNDLGRVLFFALDKFYNRVYRMLRRTRFCWNMDDHDNTDRTFPLRIAIPLVVVYLLLCAAVVHLFDYQLRGEDEKGLKFGDSFYFAFISMSTIGLGDVMPINIQYSPIMATMFVFGLVLISVINSTIYVRMERNYFRAMEMMEALFDEYHGEEIDEGTRGHGVFRAMSDAIRIATLILPNVEAERRHLSAMPDSLRSSVTSRRSVLSRRLHQQRKSSSSALPPVGSLGSNLSAIHKTLDHNEPDQKPAMLRSRALSRSDTDLTMILKHQPVLSPRTNFGSRFYLDTVREVNELTESYETSRLGRKPTISRSEANLFTLFQSPPSTQETSSTIGKRFYVDKVDEAIVDEQPELTEPTIAHVGARRRSDTDLLISRPRQFIFQLYRSLRSSRRVFPKSDESQ